MLPARGGDAVGADMAQRSSPSSHERQIGALRKLKGAYRIARSFAYIIRNGSTETVAVPGGKRSLYDVLKELSGNVVEARRELLGTGYAVPDEWLTARIAVETFTDHTRKRPLVRLLHWDAATFRRVEDSIGAAIERLTAQPTARRGRTRGATKHPRLTELQRRALHWSDAGETERKIAARLNRKQPSINRLLKRARQNRERFEELAKQATRSVRAQALATDKRGQPQL